MATIGGKRPGSGRKKGVPNKTTGALKEAVLEAFHELGGVPWLVSVAREDPKPFIGLLGRLIPHEVVGEGGGPIKGQLEVVFVNGRPPQAQASA